MQGLHPLPNQVRLPLTRSPSGLLKKVVGVLAACGEGPALGGPSGSAMLSASSRRMICRDGTGAVSLLVLHVLPLARHALIEAAGRFCGMPVQLVVQAQQRAWAAQTEWGAGDRAGEPARALASTLMTPTSSRMACSLQRTAARPPSTEPPPTWGGA